jgi:hypothetical protein
MLSGSRSIPKSERGAAMLAALCLAMVFAICLSSYIALCYTSLKMSTRNLMSSRSVELAEAGLEAALYAQNNNDWSTWTLTSPGGIPTQSMILNGFAFESGVTGQVALTVSGYGTPAPVFTSEAFVTQTDGTVFKRQLQTQGSLAPTFVNAAGATSGRVTFGTSGTLDSYDSSLGPYSTQTPGYAARVLSQSTSVFPGVVLNTADVNGYVIGSSSNPVSYASGAQIIGPTTPTTELVDPSRILTQSQPDQPVYYENLPSTGTPVTVNLVGTSTMTLGNPTATVPASYYVYGDLTLQDSAVLNITGPVIIVVYGNMSITDAAQINVATTATTAGGGGPDVSLEMHVPVGNVSIDGGGIVNNTVSPERVAIVSAANTSGTLEIGTTSPFYGVLDFPNNTLRVTGNQQIYGALVASSLIFNGSPSIHYDVHLQAGMPLMASPLFVGPVFNAFKSSPSTVNPTPPIIVGNVVEVAAQ